MESERTYILLDKELMEREDAELELRIHRANKGQNINYRFLLEFFRTEKKLYLGATKIKELSLNLSNGESEEHPT